MVSATFTRLSPPKQAAINDALLREFSRHPLNEAQVKHIVEATGIARGSFYCYFESLTDAYQHTLNTALLFLHQGIPTQLPQHREDIEEYLQRVEEFLRGAAASPYFDLFVMHYRCNEDQVRPYHPNPELDAFSWQVSTLIHATIRDCFVDYEHCAAYLSRLSHSLYQLTEKQ